MNKLFTSVFGVALCAMISLCSAPPAKAQYNPYSESTLITLANGAVTSSTSGTTVSNQWCDVHGFIGAASLTLVATNLSGSTPTLSASLYSSSDTTNWTLIANAALSTSLTNTVTNLLTGVKATNVVWTAGAGPWTNNATLSGITTGNYVGELGFNIKDVGQYLSLRLTTTGSSTPAYGYSAFLRARNSISQ